MQMNIDAPVNLADPRQDVHKVRTFRRDLHRYRTAERFLPGDLAGQHILEIGGGAGEMSERLLLRGAMLTFVDLSEANVARATARGAEAHRCDLNLGLPFLGKGHFDYAVMLEVIEHVVAAEFLLREVRRVLKDGGTLLLSTPNFSYWRNRVAILCGKLSRDEGYHFRFFTPSVLRSRLYTAGFAITRSAHSMPAFGYNFVANRILRKPRRHLHIRGPASSLLAHTLFVEARAIVKTG